MAFVEIDKIPGLDLETLGKLVEEVYGSGPRLKDGELFRIAGSTDDGIYVLNGWDSREACDRTMAAYMEAFQRYGLSMDGAVHEEYEIHDADLAAGQRIAV
jgi:hypothetical protein